MLSEAFVKLALQTLDCSQKTLAIRLKVSPTQISKWKNGEHMSSDMEKKLRAITDIGDLDPSLVLLTGSIENSMKWERLIRILADSALMNAETGFETYPLLDEMNELSSNTLDVLNRIGVAIPEDFPRALDLDFIDMEDEQAEERFWEAVEENPHASLIQKIYNILNDVYGFYYAYVEKFMDDQELGLFDIISEIESNLLALSACKIEEKLSFAPNMSVFKYKVQKDYSTWLNTVKEKAFRAGIPLGAELLDLAYASAGELGYEAEAESLGINASRLHPDVYMNELLVGMRTIHQVLPAILKKLEIHEEFSLDPSDFKIHTNQN